MSINKHHGDYNNYNDYDNTIMTIMTIMRAHLLISTPRCIAGCADACSACSFLLHDALRVVPTCKARPQATLPGAAVATRSEAYTIFSISSYHQHII